ncbi:MULTISPECIES: metal ABC transporter ATP-binding protein [Mumia]|uniref:Metal ABC transporter ATP-binding protein n=1 Tax=Mumia xiangluensis TaxID=1678900 RepID=A0ABW1QPK0_9ACTN|nr:MULTISPECIES: ATP-binding cassette domain-containing protein [Mumia]
MLRGAHLEARAGEVTALAGGNGAGKTTLLDVVCGVREPERGEVWRPGRLAYVPQRTAVDARLPLTVGGLVATGTWAHRGLLRPLRRRDRATVGRAMERLGIVDLARRRVDELSGGQVQRALVARALATEAPVLVLDEPTTGLDCGTRRDLLAILAEIAAEGRVVLQATHDDSALDASDVVVELLHGRSRVRHTVVR